MSKLPYPSIGQRVVCIDDDWQSKFPTAGLVLPHLKQVYTISSIYEHFGHIYLTFKEIPLLQKSDAGLTHAPQFAKANFKPVAETDISDLLALQNPTPDQIEALRRHDAQRWSVPVKETT